LKPERWGSPLVQEKYQEEKASDKRHPYRIIIIIIIIIIIGTIPTTTIIIQYNTIHLSKHSNALMSKPENDLWSHKWWCI